MLIKEGRLTRREFGLPVPEHGADTHGQLRFNFRHPRIRGGEETEYLLRTFRRDFEVNGPSVTRIARTLLRGWLALKDHPDPCVRERIAFETKDLAAQYAGGAVGVRAVVRPDERGSRRAAARDPPRDRAGLRQEGQARRPSRRSDGPRHALARGAALRQGRSYEPEAFYEANDGAIGRPEVASLGATPCRWVTPPDAPTASEEVA